MTQVTDAAAMRYSLRSSLILNHSDDTRNNTRYSIMIAPPPDATRSETYPPPDATNSEKYPPADMTLLNLITSSVIASITVITTCGTRPAMMLSISADMHNGTSTDAMNMIGILMNMDKTFIRWNTYALSGSTPACTEIGIASHSPISFSSGPPRKHIPSSAANDS